MKFKKEGTFCPFVRSEVSEVPGTSSFIYAIKGMLIFSVQGTVKCALTCNDCHFI